MDRGLDLYVCMYEDVCIGAVCMYVCTYVLLIAPVHFRPCCLWSMKVTDFGKRWLKDRAEGKLFVSYLQRAGEREKVKTKRE